MDSRFIGTVGFTGPEVFKKEGHTTGMVVFSIGNIMYIMFKQAAHHYKRVSFNKAVVDTANIGINGNRT